MIELLARHSLRRKMSGLRQQLINCLELRLSQSHGDIGLAADVRHRPGARVIDALPKNLGTRRLDLLNERHRITP
ncbi:hypothetical protein PY365_32625 [Roseiarcaceae bacterium H3SJ34-1]|uniref:hypothetical protein n=1 Tax=Terripilifer ovatus TaxID=3032367 RepID=UPI003AB9A198|nr:hypothetical protein [Roseiarcaceae bacterium H3SJ34-1]